MSTVRPPLFDFLTSYPVIVFCMTVMLTVGVVVDGLVASIVFYVLVGVFAATLSARFVFPKGDVFEYENNPAPPSLPAPRTSVALTERPDLFPTRVVIDRKPLVVFSDPGVPGNLPTVGYETSLAADHSEDAAEAEAALARTLEAQAHAGHVLLSSDALRHFLATVPSGVDPSMLLATVMASAKKSYPSEDGWVVINESRMREACVECLAAPMATSDEAPYVPTVVPAGTGSLAEMIAAGNLGAAYALIGHRPMFSLADAVADFDALYRARQGQDTNTSALLKEVTAQISTDTIKAITVALTSALDGTYNDEAEAVKTAIMKAVKVRG
jgi:hypothetical protein